MRESLVCLRLRRLRQHHLGSTWLCYSNFSKLLFSNAILEADRIPAGHKCCMVSEAAFCCGFGCLWLRKFLQECNSPLRRPFSHPLDLAYSYSGFLYPSFPSEVHVLTLELSSEQPLHLHLLISAQPIPSKSAGHSSLPTKESPSQWIHPHFPAALSLPSSQDYWTQNCQLSWACRSISISLLYPLQFVIL